MKHRVSEWEHKEIQEDNYDLVSQYVSGKEYTQDQKRWKSAYSALLIDARALPEGNWLRALAYLVFIDHVGGLFLNKDKRYEPKEDFFRCLGHFTGLEDWEINILYQFRNSLVHQFNLFNFPKRRGFDCRIFRVGLGLPSLIIRPGKPWNGTLSSKMSDSVTEIDISKLSELGEEIHKMVSTLLTQGKLLVRIPEKYSNLNDYLRLNSITW